MSATPQRSRVAVLSALWAIAAFAAGPAGEAKYARKYVVILSSGRELKALPEESNAKLRAWKPALSIDRLTSQHFSGLRPCYEVLLAAAFASEAEANALAERLRAAGVEADVRRTGRYLGAQARDAACAAGAEETEAGFWQSSASARLENGDPVAAWVANQRRTLEGKRPGAALELVGEPLVRETTTVLIRVTEGKACQLEAWQLEPSDAGDIRSARLMGAECCALAECEDRSPGGWMLHLLRSCPKAGGLVDARGAAYSETSVTHGDSSVSRARITRQKADLLCAPEVQTFECPSAFEADGSALCRTRAVGERAIYTWQRSAQGAFVREVENTVEN